MRGNLNVNQGSVFLAMLPNARSFGVRRRLRGAFLECRDVFPRTNVLDCQGKKFFPRLAVVPDGGTIHVQDGQGLRVIDPHGMWITVEKQMVSLLRLAKRFLRSLALGDVVENDNATMQGAILTSERSAGNTEATAIRHLRVTDEELCRVNVFAPHRQHQRQFV